MLEHLRIKELPKQYEEGSGFWLRAVVKVRKADNRNYYAIAERNGWGVMRYVKDCGPMMRIIALVGVYPFMYLNEKRYAIRNEGESDKRKRLSDFFRAHYAQLSAEAGTDTGAGGRYSAEGERLAALAMECPAAELVSLDRERMAIRQKQEWGRASSEYATREALDAESRAIIGTVSDKITAAVRGGTLSVPIAASVPAAEVENTPVERVPVENAPVENAPVEDTPGEPATSGAPVKPSPRGASPAARKRGRPRKKEA